MPPLAARPGFQTVALSGGRIEDWDQAQKPIARAAEINTDLIAGGVGMSFPIIQQRFEPERDAGAK